MNFDTEQNFKYLREYLTEAQNALNGAVTKLDHIEHLEALSQARARLAPVMADLNNAFHTHDLPAMACYDMDSGFDMIRVYIPPDSEWDEAGGLLIEDSFADTPRVGVYPPGGSQQPEDAPIFPLGEENERLQLIDRETLVNTVVALVRFRLGV